MPRALTSAGTGAELTPNLPGYLAPRHREGRPMSDDLTKKGGQDRSRINMNEEYEVKYWSHHLGVSREDLEKAIAKVGNSAAAVRKELGK